MPNIAIMERAYSQLEVKEVSQDERVIRGIATTPTPDRMGDIVEPLGIEFKNPLILLHQHDSKRPVGHVTFGKPSKAGIPFEAKLVTVDEPGELKNRVDLAWQEVRAKLVRAVSIGFRAIETAFMESGGMHFLRSEVLELSLVTIPANADATITGIKAIDTAIRAASGPTTRPASRVVSTTGKPKEGAMAHKTAAERIAELEAAIAAKNKLMDEIDDTVATEGVTKSAEQRETYDTLDGEIKALVLELKDARAREQRMIATARAVTPPRTADEASDMRGGARVQILPPSMPKGVGFIRMLGARFMAREYNMSAAEIAISKGWGEDLAAVLRTPPDLLEKAAVSGASTTDPAWAGALVTYQNLQNDFIELLRPRTIIGRIPGIRQVPFNIKVPRETGETTAYWVAQAAPKAVSKGALDTITLDFNKVAGLTFLTKELLKFSQPSAETMMVNSLTKAIIKLTDNDFLDPSKAAVAGVSPASITNGTTPITASGLSADAFRADFADLLAAYTAANYTLDDLVLVMGQTQALRIGLMRNDFGSKEFPDINKDGGVIEGIPVVTSENVASNGGSPADGRIIVALAANSILMADDGGIEVNVSTEASIQTDDAPDSPATASTVMVSMFQTNQVAILCERFITWAKARPGAAVYITGGNYGN